MWENIWKYNTFLAKKKYNYILHWVESSYVAWYNILIVQQNFWKNLYFASKYFLTDSWTRILDKSLTYNFSSCDADRK